MQSPESNSPKPGAHPAVGAAEREQSSRHTARDSQSRPPEWRDFLLLDLPLLWVAKSRTPDLRDIERNQMQEIQKQTMRIPNDWENGQTVRNPENPPLKTDENPDSHEDCRYIIPMKTVGCYILSLQVSAVPRYPLKVSKKNKVLLPKISFKAHPEVQNH